MPGRKTTKAAMLPGAITHGGLDEDLVLRFEGKLRQDPVVFHAERGRPGGEGTSIDSTLTASSRAGSTRCSTIAVAQETSTPSRPGEVKTGVLSALRDCSSGWEIPCMLRVMCLIQRNQRNKPVDRSARG